MPKPTATSSSGAAMDSMSPTAGTTPGAAMGSTDSMDTGAAANEPVALSGGQFGEIDTIHKEQGKATLFKLPDGKRVLPS
jgi:hypothetical protein